MAEEMHTSSVTGLQAVSQVERSELIRGCRCRRGHDSHTYETHVVENICNECHGYAYRVSPQGLLIEKQTWLYTQG